MRIRRVRPVRAVVRPNCLQFETLYPGDVIGSGTVGGGCGLELGTFLEDGNTIELEIEGIGVLEHTVVE